LCPAICARAVCRGGAWCVGQDPAITPRRQANEEWFSGSSRTVTLSEDNDIRHRRVYSLALKVHMKRAAGGSPSQPGDGRGRGTGKRPGPLLNNALAAIKSFNAAGLEQTLNRASTELSRPAFLQQTVAPLIEQIGIYWQSGQIEAIQLQDLSDFCAALDTLLGKQQHQ
jgi:hypothetical protein